MGDAIRSCSVFPPLAHATTPPQETSRQRAADHAAASRCGMGACTAGSRSDGPFTPSPYRTREPHAARRAVPLVGGRSCPGAVDTLTHNQIAPLRGSVDYLALGHVHKNYEHDGWIYNPGALEACGIEEGPWKRGFYHVQIDTTHTLKHQAHLIENTRRPFYRLAFGVDSTTSPHDLYDRLPPYLAEQAPAQNNGKKPVVELRLHGVLPFDHADLDLEHVRTLVEQAYQPLHVRIKNDTRSAEFAVQVTQDVSQEELARSSLALLHLACDSTTYLVTSNVITSVVGCVVHSAISCSMTARFFRTICVCGWFSPSLAVKIASARS